MGGISIAYLSPFLHLAVVFSAGGGLAGGGCRRRPYVCGGVFSCACSANDGRR